MPLRILDTGSQSASRNMEIDAQLLDSLHPDDDPILHLYEWNTPSATYGYFLNPYDYLTKQSDLTLARRPTGGGIIFHLTDLAFSLLIPANHPNYSINTLDNYCNVNKKVMQIIHEFDPSLLKNDPTPATPACANFCMAKPTKYDVMIGTKKVGGAAQRRTKNGFLHQGSISLAQPPEEFLRTHLLNPSPIIQAMNDNTYTLCKSNTPQELATAKTKLRQLLTTTFA